MTDRRELVQAIRMAEDQQTILDLCDELDRLDAAASVRAPQEPSQPIETELKPMLTRYLILIDEGEGIVSRPGYLCEAADAALAAKDETIAALREELNRVDGKEYLLRGQLAELAQAVWPSAEFHILAEVVHRARSHREELLAVRQQLADAQLALAAKDETIAALKGDA